MPDTDTEAKQSTSTSKEESDHSVPCGTETRKTGAYKKEPKYEVHKKGSSKNESFKNESCKKDATKNEDEAYQNEPFRDEACENKDCKNKTYSIEIEPWIPSTMYTEINKGFTAENLYESDDSFQKGKKSSSIPALEFVCLDDLGAASIKKRDERSDDCKSLNGIEERTDKPFVIDCAKSEGDDVDLEKPSLPCYCKTPKINIVVRPNEEEEEEEPNVGFSEMVNEENTSVPAARRNYTSTVLAVMLTVVLMVGGAFFYECFKPKDFGH